MGDRFYGGQSRKRSNAKGPQTFDKETFAMQLDSGITDALQALSDNFVEQVCRPAAFVAVTVLYDEMLLRVPKHSGTLENSIYRWREKSGTDKRAVFYVGPNKRIARHWWLVEHGHFQIYKVYWNEEKQAWRTTRKLLPTPIPVAAQPYIRPTYDSKMKVALQAGLAEMQRRIKDKDLWVDTGRGNA
jgi:hypothetical protein